MAQATLKTAQAAINAAGIPLELVRGEGYHYFVFDRPDLNIYETESVMIPYTNSVTAEKWAEYAQVAYDSLLTMFELQGRKIIAQENA